MNRSERQQLRAVVAEVAQWAGRARSVNDTFASVSMGATDALAALRRNVVRIGERARIMLLEPSAGQRLAAVARHRPLAAVTAADRRWLEQLTTTVAAGCEDVKRLFGVRRLFSGETRRDQAHQAADYIADIHRSGLQGQLPDRLHWLSTLVPDIDVVTTSAALADDVGPTARTTDLGHSPRVIDAAELPMLGPAITRIEQMLASEEVARTAVTVAANAVRQAEARAILETIDVERLRDVTRGRLQLGPLKDEGISTVQQVLDVADCLDAVPGIGTTTANRLSGAAHALRQTTFDEMPVRFDIGSRTDEATVLLRHLAAWDAVRVGSHVDRARVQDLAPLAHELHRDLTRVIVYTAAGHDWYDLRREIDEVVRFSQELAGRRRTARPGAAARSSIHGTTSCRALPTTTPCSLSSASSPRMRRRRTATFPTRSSMPFAPPSWTPNT